MFALVLAALVHHAVSTQVPAAQEAFDEGLTLVYAFNRDEAQRRFTAAANADPNLALAWWGVALAAGPNLNFDMTKKDWTTVQQALGKAVLLQSRASPEEQRLIAALQKRYPQKAQEPDGAAYRDAMAAIHRDFPSDDDVAALYVESAMDVDEWGWKPDGSPVGKTSELAATLRGVIARSPAHPGANHYFTHLMDFQSVAEQAEPSANLLASLPVQPAASHLKHMSGHIYLDVGSFVPLLVQNREAVEMDRSYAASIGTTPQKLDYYLHNLDFYAGGALMLDDRAEAERAAGFFNEAESRGSMFVYARMQRYTEVLASNPPAVKSDWRDRFDWIAYRYTRGIAYVSLHNVGAARQELDALEAISSTLKPHSYFRAYVEQLESMLRARVAFADGDVQAATRGLRSVIAATASLSPETFPVWYLPAGEWLGWMLLQSGNPVEAEAAFRADLLRSPNNARDLYGLMQSLSMQGRIGEARPLAEQVAANWRGSDDDLRDRL